MAIKTFKVGKVKIDANDLGETESANLSIDLDTAEKTQLGESWKSYLALAKSWNLSITMKYNPDNTAQAALRDEFIAGDGDLAAVAMYEDAVKYFHGAAIITNFGVTKVVNSPDMVSISILGNGALSYT